ncbi:ZN862-like protein [Mya arenaria]|uniref:ZN862-like protein n=1 Tax=Mya arenaria TaxID=6604 RepID=A0ABY7F336_MYAAR|nr:ZN862-like protein [Mya arenaria]
MQNGDNYPLFTKGYVPDCKKRKTETEKRKKEYEATGRKREFKSNWLKEFTWLRYDCAKNQMTCNTCKVYGNETVGPFILGSMTFRKECLKSHEKSECHMLNIEREYAKLNPTKTIAPKTLQSLNLKTMNQLSLKFRNAHFLCKFGKPYTDYEELCKLDEAKSLDVGSQYGNDKAALEFTKFIAEAERERIRSHIKTCKFVSVISDGTTDCSFQEAEIVLIRTCSKGDISVFFSLVKNVPRGDAQTVCEVLTSGLKLLCPEFKDKLIGTDGASTMLGAKTGAVQRLRELTDRPYIVGVHCNGHKLELAFRDSLKAKITLFNKVELFLINLYYFYRNSNVTRTGLKDSYKTLGMKVMLPVRIGGTRWLSHMKTAVNVFLNGYNAIVQHLGQLQNRDVQVSRTEKGNKALHFYRAARSKDVFLLMHFLLDVLGILSEVSKKFQEKTCLIQDILTEIDMAIKSLEKLKTRDGLHLREAYQHAKFNELTGNERAFVSAREKLISAIIESLRLRFTDQPGIISACQAFSLRLFPAHESDALDYGDTEVDMLVDYFRQALETAGTEVDQLAPEWTKLKSHIYKRFDNPSTITWRDVNSKLGQVCPNILQLVDPVLSIPASSADAERGFSRLKNTKTDKRSRLLNGHLSDQLMIMMESSDPNSFDPVPAITLWNVGNRRVQQEQTVNVVLANGVRDDSANNTVNVVEHDENFNVVEHSPDRETMVSSIYVESSPTAGRRLPMESDLLSDRRLVHLPSTWTMSGVDRTRETHTFRI